VSIKFLASAKLRRSAFWGLVPVSLNILRIGLAIQFAGIFGAALAGSTTVTGSSGLTVATQTSGSSGWWVADSSAQTATITYDGSISVFSGNQHPFGVEFKCMDGAVFGPKTLRGLAGFISDASGSAGVSTGGQTRFSDPNGTAPQYYETSWITTATTTGTGGMASSGTYDPWSYTVAALQAGGVQLGTNIDYYFQVRLGAGSTVLPGAAEQGEFRFNAYATDWTSTTTPFLSASVKRTPGGFTVLASQSSDPDVTVYQLPAGVALNDALTPTGKIALGTLMGPNGVQNTFTGNLSGIGAVINDLHFGVIVHNFATPVGLGSNDVVFATHFDTYGQIGPVPEPSTFAVLGSAGLLVLLRRRFVRR
jgi:hypothetical protein